MKNNMIIQLKQKIFIKQKCLTCVITGLSYCICVDASAAFWWQQINKINEYMYYSSEVWLFFNITKQKKKKENVSSLDNYIRTGKVACTF